MNYSDICPKCGKLMVTGMLFSSKVGYYHPKSECKPVRSTTRTRRVSYGL